jgi:hypothetical protein
MKMRAVPFFSSVRSFRLCKRSCGVNRHCLFRSSELFERLATIQVQPHCRNWTSPRCRRHTDMCGMLHEQGH